MSCEFCVLVEQLACADCVWCSRTSDVSLRFIGAGPSTATQLTFEHRAKQVQDIKSFIEIARRKDAKC